MQRFFYNLKEKLRRATYGAYGQDELSRALSIFSMVCLFLSFFRIFGFLYIVALVALIWSIYRTFSKNHAKRIKERNTYLKLIAKPKSFFNIQKRRFAERKTHDYYKCPRCKTYNRIPKGHGKILITCPKCKNQFERK